MDATARPTKATTVEFDRDTGTAVVFERIMRSCLRHAEANAKLINDKTPEACHQTRIGLRRARSAVWLFKPYLNKKLRKPLNRAFRDAGRQLSPLRDWDVFVTETLPRLVKREKSEWVGRLGEKAEAKRLSAYQELNTEIPRPTYCHLLDETTLDPFTPISITAPDMLDQAYVTVRHRYRRLSTPEQRHELRKSMKKLRYAIEFFGQLYDSKPVKAFLDACKEMQNVLGDINDSQTMVHLVDELGNVPADWLSGVEQREAKIVDHLAKHVARFCSVRPFWD